MNVVNTGSVILQLYPVQNEPGQILIYTMKVKFRVINYEHEETLMGTNIEDIKTSARFIAKAVARELKASLDDAIANL